MSGRGRLSSIELLGEEYDDIVRWAATELRERSQLQIDILGEFNRRLEARAHEVGDDFEPVSKSAFNRYAMRLAGIARRLQYTREISQVLTDRLQPGDTDTVTIALAEAIKTAVFEGIGEAGEGGSSMMDLKFAGDALKSAVAAQKASAELRTKMEAAILAKVAKAAETAGTVAKARGMSVETVEAIKASILGIAPRTSTAPQPAEPAS